MATSLHSFFQWISNMGWVKLGWEAVPLKSRSGRSSEIALNLHPHFTFSLNLRPKRGSNITEGVRRLVEAIEESSKSKSSNPLVSLLAIASASSFSLAIFVCIAFSLAFASSNFSNLSRVFCPKRPYQKGLFGLLYQFSVILTCKYHLTPLPLPHFHWVLAIFAQHFANNITMKPFNIFSFWGNGG